MIQFLFGACAGAALALLYAPATGRSTRAKLKEKARKAQHKLGDLRSLAEQKERHMANQMLGIEHKLCEFGDKAGDKVAVLKDKMCELKLTVSELTEQLGVTAAELKGSATSAQQSATEIAGELKGSAASAMESASEIVEDLKGSAASAVDSATAAIKAAKTKMAETLKEQPAKPAEDFRPAKDIGTPHPAQQPVQQKPILDEQWHERRMGMGA